MKKFRIGDLFRTSRGWTVQITDVLSDDIIIVQYSYRGQVRARHVFKRVKV